MLIFYKYTLRAYEIENPAIPAVIVSLDKTAKSAAKTAIKLPSLNSSLLTIKI
jgi:hypothetical protein